MSQETREEALRRLGYMSPEAAQAAALKLARGDYQRGIITGENAWSGSDLRGAASKYGARYKESRHALLKRIQQAGIPVRVEAVGHHRKLTLIFGTQNT